MDYQSNSRKEREKTERPEKNIEKVIVGEVIQKPKGIGFKFRTIFFGGDARTAGSFVWQEVVLPALRTLVVDMVKTGAERVVWGESTYRRRPQNVNYNQSYPSRFQYEPSRGPWSNPIRQSFNPTPARRVNRHDMRDYILETKEEAELVVERLLDILDKYEVVSLADLNDLLGLEGSFIDNKWGWTYLNSIKVVQVAQGYLLELPQLEEI